MGIDTLLVSFFAIATTLGIGVAFIYRFSNAVADLESKVTGIWVNEANTLRILIYSQETVFQAEVVWSSTSDINLLGSDVIQNLNLKYFGSEGTYIDPFTKKHFDLKLKLKNPGCLHFHLEEKIGSRLKRVEAWKLVQ